MKLKLVAFWLIVFGALFAFLQANFHYHFYYIEQSQLFLFSPEYWMGKVGLPGGFSKLLSEFLVQFFTLPYAGAGIVAALLTGVGVGVMGVVKRIAPSVKLFALYLLPIIFLLFMHFDFNYRVQGTITYLVMLGVLNGYLRIKDFNWRMGAGFIIVPVLYWLLGSITLLFVLSACLYELLKRESKWYISFIMGGEVLLLGIGCVYFAVTGEYRWAFMPDLYYHDTLEPKSVIYYSWICLLLVMLIAWSFRNKNFFSGKKWLSGFLCLAQLAVVGGVMYWGYPKYSDQKTFFLKELDYYARTEQWDKTIKACQGKLTNYLYMCYLNMALAYKGMLANTMFHFDQRGLPGLVVQWNKSENISCLLSDIYFTIGSISLAQEMAFEGYVSAMEDGNPRMLKRLVQTNLIYGAYPVAEKYITVLEKTFAYSDWARSQRKFLYNDEAIEADPILGIRRRSLPKQNQLSQLDGQNADMERAIQANPSNQIPIQFLGAYYLVSKDMGGFKDLVERYYGTDALPELPVHFQEAVIVMSEKEPDYWKQFRVSENVLARFAEFKKIILANRGNSSLPGSMYRAYGDTYWFYFMFK